MRGKYVLIAATSAVMLGSVFVAGNAALRRSPALHEPPLRSELIEGEAETFRLMPHALALKDRAAGEKNGNRTLASFHSRRAFPGAPPVIPHPLDEDRTMGGKGCLGCHRDGGYVPAFKAYTPVTPHPQYENCRQCHLPQNRTPLFASTAFEKMAAPEIDGQHLPGGPPPIPHSLQMRENCNACHAGPGAVAEIRTPHPERVNCRQCHVPAEPGASVFDRGGLR